MIAKSRDLKLVKATTDFKNLKGGMQGYINTKYLYYNSLGLLYSTRFLPVLLNPDKDNNTLISYYADFYPESITNYQDTPYKLYSLKFPSGIKLILNVESNLSNSWLDVIAKPNQINENWTRICKHNNLFMPFSSEEFPNSYRLRTAYNNLLLLEEYQGLELIANSIKKLDFSDYIHKILISKKK